MTCGSAVPVPARNREERDVQAGLGNIHFKARAEAMGGVFYAVAVASLDDAEPDELAGSITYVDGRHDIYDKTPEDTRYL
jgi:hypothetical protein